MILYKMFLQKLTVVLALYVVLCYGTPNINVSPKLRVKRAHTEVEQSNLEVESAKENFENRLPTLKNKSSSKMGSSKPDAFNLRLDDVARPLSKIVPLLSIVKNTQSPVELLRNNDQHKQPSHEIDSSDVSEVNDNSISKTFRESEPKYRKLHENTDCEDMNKEYKNKINKSQQNLKSNNKNSRDIVLVNEMNNHHENENLEDKNCINDSIHSIIEILEKSLRNSSPNETKLQETLGLHDDIEEIPNADSDTMPDNNRINSEDENYNEMNTTNNDTFTPDERVIQILQEQNNFLKSILFKTFSYGNDTIDRRHENKPIRINLTLNINNLGANEDDCKLNSIKRKSRLYTNVYSKKSNRDFEKDAKNCECKITTAIRNNLDLSHNECVRSHYITKDNYIPHPYFNQSIIRLPVNQLNCKYKDSNRPWSYSYNNYRWLNTIPPVNANINCRRSDNLKYTFKFIPCDYKKHYIPLPLNYNTEQVESAPNCLETKIEPYDIYRNQLLIQNYPYYYINS